MIRREPATDEQIAAMEPIYEQPATDEQIEKWTASARCRTGGPFAIRDGQMLSLIARIRAEREEPIMTSKHTMSGVTTKLRKLLQAMPNTDRGIIWQRSDGLDGERLEVFGSVATALKYILDNADDVVAALAPSEAEPVEDEAAIDALRHKAFMSNSEADRQAYFDAVSKWFQHRHYRRMAHTDSSSEAEPVAWVDELGNFWLTEAVAKQYDAKPLYTHPDSSSEAMREAAHALTQTHNFLANVTTEDQEWAEGVDQLILAALDYVNSEVKK